MQNNSPNNNALKQQQSFTFDDEPLPDQSSLLFRSDTIPSGSLTEEDYKRIPSEGDPQQLSGETDETPKKQSFPYSYFALSQTGMIETKPKKANQDRYLCLPNFTNDPAKSLFGVFDGHGGSGEIVSQFLVNVLPGEVARELVSHPNNPSEALSKAFLSTSESLVDRESNNCTFSGSTAVSVYMDGGSLFCANCGDSRAVVGSFGEDGRIIAVPLSDDHKPERMDECRRILDKNGRIEPCRGSAGEAIGPLRVWLKRQNLPGLAMTRSFGDLVAASVGVICDPEVVHYQLSENDRFIILASDGVWEFISSQEAVELVASCVTANEACQLLVDESTKRWRREEDVVDDITAVVIFF
jgi:serine/threonine protein phosphatase PrpC